MKLIAEIRGMLTGLALVATALLMAASVDFGLAGQGLLTSLRFHIAGGMILLPVLFLLFGARLRSVVMLGVIFLSAGQGFGLILAQQDRRTALEGRNPLVSFTALSFNVLSENRSGVEAASYVAGSNVDVVTLMEAKGIVDGLAQIEQRYPYRIGCEKPAEVCDVAILSQTPLLQPQRHYLFGVVGRWRLLEAATIIDGQRVTLFALHLSKPYFDRAALLEMEQARAVIEKATGPVLLMGDFNAAAWSNEVEEFATKLDLIPSPSYPPTWPVELPGLGVPIDNMFTRGNALIRAIDATPSAFGSNHLGLLATVDLF